jgi:hypothetical protein
MRKKIEWGAARGGGHQERKGGGGGGGGVGKTTLSNSAMDSPTTDQPSNRI